MAKQSIVNVIESYLNRFMVFPAQSGYALVCALWAIHTHIWPHLDTVPYLFITADTKRSGKTTLMELLSFVSANAYNVAGMTESAMFRTITQEKPTLFIDEAENSITSENSPLRAVVNVGYRRGAYVSRVGKGGEVLQFETFCPKAFVMIGDPYDTLNDRCLIIRLARSGNAPEKYRRSIAETDGAIIREQVSLAIQERHVDVLNQLGTFTPLDFLNGREEDIWTPLFALARVFCPNRISELSRIAVDMATDKTQDRRDYRELLATKEKEAAAIEYGERLLLDLFAILNDRDNKHVWQSSRGERCIPTSDVVAALYEIATAPWRKFRGEGLTAYTMGDLLDQFNVHPQTIRIGKGKQSKTMKGYKRSDVDAAIKRNGLL